MKVKFIETESFSTWLEDNIIFLIFKKVKVDISVAMEAVEMTTNISQNQILYYYVDISQIKSVSKEAREYLAIRRTNDENMATAVLAPNIISKLIGTFFISFNNPGIKFKIFNSEEEALIWLKKQTEGEKQ